MPHSNQPTSKGPHALAAPTTPNLAAPTPAFDATQLPLRRGESNTFTDAKSEHKLTKTEDTSDHGDGHNDADTDDDAEAPLEVQIAMRDYVRGDRPKLLAQLGLRVITEKSLNGKIRGLILSKKKADKLSNLTEELTQRLHTASKKDVQQMKADMQAMVRDWGLSAATLDKTKDYRLVARLLAYCVTLAR